MKRLFLFVLALSFGLIGCNKESMPAVTGVGSETAVAEATSAPRGMGMGPNSGMSARHHAPIPDEYADLMNPVTADEPSLERGAEIYVERCASCHGDGGMGDGPAAAGLDPGPTAIAHTSQMMGDDYLFYRISEGGLFDPFNSLMPPWKDILDEQARWDILNYVRALGSGQVMPGRRMSGEAFDPEAEAANHAEMIAQGVEQGIITQADGDVFLAVHAEMDILKDAGLDEMGGGMGPIQARLLAELVADGRITQTDAAIFSDVHDRLTEAGLME